MSQTRHSFWRDILWLSLGMLGPALVAGGLAALLGIGARVVGHVVTVAAVCGGILVHHWKLRPADSEE